jgi:hypothetical protein
MKKIIIIIIMILSFGTTVLVADSKSPTSKTLKNLEEVREKFNIELGVFYNAREDFEWLHKLLKEDKDISLVTVDRVAFDASEYFIRNLNISKILTSRSKKDFEDGIVAINKVTSRLKSMIKYMVTIKTAKYESKSMTKYMEIRKTAKDELNNLPELFHNHPISMRIKTN